MSSHTIVVAAQLFLSPLIGTAHIRLLSILRWVRPYSAIVIVIVIVIVFLLVHRDCRYSSSSSGTQSPSVSEYLIGGIIFYSSKPVRQLIGRAI